MILKNMVFIINYIYNGQLNNLYYINDEGTNIKAMAGNNDNLIEGGIMGREIQETAK